MARRFDADPTRSEGVARGWAARRAAEFHAAVARLAAPHSPGALPELQRAAHIVSESLAAQIPAGQDALPRGYRVVANRWGDPCIAFGDVLFNPIYSAPAPNAAQLERFAQDLRSGWIREVVEATGTVLNFLPFAIFEEIKR